MKKWFVLVLFLAACGDEDGSNDGSESQTNGTQTTGVSTNNQAATNNDTSNNQASTNNQTATNNQSTNNQTTTNSNNNTNGNTNNVAGCGTSHPRVGQSLVLSTRSHGVSGTATVIDDCTIEVEGFNYDGGGVDVRFYGGLGGNYVNGFPMTDDLVGTRFTNDQLTITIPDGRSLDDIDGLSVWCFDFSVSFGDGLFAP